MDSEDELELLRRAIDGDRDALGTLIDQHRAYLVILASRQLDPVLSSRLSGSDIAQQTCMEAIRGFDTFRGQVPEQFLAWLRQILMNNLVEATRVHLQAQRRSIHREQQYRGDPKSDGNSSFPFSADDSSPSSRVMRGERAVRLAQIMDRLPSDQFEAIRLRYLEGWSLNEISEKMNRSKSAVAGLIKRGLQELRQTLSSTENSSHG